MSERSSERNNFRPRVHYTNGEIRTKRVWSFSEDQKLRELVSVHSTKNWTKLAAALAPRTGKQCRERWYNHLADNLKKGDWTEDEDKILIQLQKIYGNQWTKIAKRLPHRTDSSVKNRWHNIMRHGVPENYEHDVDEKLLEEIREEQRSEKEKGGPKVYRKGTTVSSVYAYSSPPLLSTPTMEVDPGDASSNNSISTTNMNSTNSMSMASSETNASSSETFAQQQPQQQQAKALQKKRDVQQISLDRDEMMVAQFLATSGSNKASKS